MMFRNLAILATLALASGYQFKEGDEIHAKRPLEAFPEKCKYAGVQGKCGGQGGKCRCTIERGTNLKIVKTRSNKKTGALEALTLKDTATGMSYLCSSRLKKGKKQLARPCIGNGPDQFPAAFTHEACRAEEQSGNVYLFGYGSDCWKGKEPAKTSKNLSDKPVQKYFGYVEGLKRMWWWREATYRGAKDHHSYIPILADGGKVAELQKYWSKQGDDKKTEAAYVDPDAEMDRTYGCLWQVDGGKKWSKDHKGMTEREELLKRMDAENPGYRRIVTKAYPFRAPQESVTIDVFQDGKTPEQTFSFRPPKPEITVVTYAYNFGARSIQEYAMSRDNRDAKEACDVGTQGYLEPWNHLAGDRTDLEDAAETISNDESTRGVSELKGKKYPGDRSNLAYFARTYRVLDAIAGVDGMTAEIAKTHDMEDKLGDKAKLLKSHNSILIRGALDESTMRKLRRIRDEQDDRQDL